MATRDSESGLTLNKAVDGGSQHREEVTLPKQTSFRSFVKSNVGLLLIMASQGFFASMNVTVQKLNRIDPPVSALQLILVRMVITYFCSVTYMICTRIPNPFIGPQGVRMLLVFRGSSGFVGLFGLYYSLQFLSLSDATVLTFLSPLTTGIAGYFFLREPFTMNQALAGVASLVGVVFIARPSSLFGISTFTSMTNDNSTTQRLIAVCVSLFGVCGMTGAYVTIRALGSRIHPLHAMVAFSTQCVIGSSIGMLVFRMPIVIPTQWQWLGCLILIGLFGFIAQFLLTMGLQREKVAKGTTAIYTQMVFALILEFTFFGTLPSALSAMGAIIIIGAALFVALSQKKRTPSIQQLASANSSDGETTALMGSNGDNGRSYTS